MTLNKDLVLFAGTFSSSLCSDSWTSCNLLLMSAGISVYRLCKPSLRRSSLAFWEDRSFISSCKHGNWNWGESEKGRNYLLSHNLKKKINKIVKKWGLTCFLHWSEETSSKGRMAKMCCSTSPISSWTCCLSLSSAWAAATTSRFLSFKLWSTLSSQHLWH